MNKNQARLRRAKRTRAKIKRDDMPRLAVHKTGQHTYAQLISPCGKKVLAAAGTVESDIKAQVKHGANIAAAQVVGKAIAERAKAAGITTVAFDRSGFKYHGRVKALADAAREAGIQF